MSARRLPFLLLLLAALLLPLAVVAVEPDELLGDPALEARARALSQEIRCVVCQNESIDSSNAAIARDLRVLLRERILAGDSDREIRAYLVARYGDFVLLRPPLRPGTWALWFGPFAILLAALGAIACLLLRRRGRAPAAAPLGADEQRRLAALLEGEERQ